MKLPVFFLLLQWLFSLQTEPLVRCNSNKKQRSRIPFFLLRLLTKLPIMLMLWKFVVLTTRQFPDLPWKGLHGGDKGGEALVVGRIPRPAPGGPKMLLWGRDAPSALLGIHQRQLLDRVPHEPHTQGDSLNNSETFLVPYQHQLSRIWRFPCSDYVDFYFRPRYLTVCSYISAQM